MFTQKISMDCTQEQYEKFLKDELLKMGYKERSTSGWYDSNNYYFTNCYGDSEHEMGNISKSCVTDYDIVYLGTFNAPLFLALAAMTDKPEGGHGEAITNNSGMFILTYNGQLRDINDRHLETVYDWRKATVSEIMEKFGEKQLTNLDKLAARVEKLEKIMEKQEPEVGSILEVLITPQIIPYQLCPKCGGEGKITMMVLGGCHCKTFPCDLCNGKMMIPMHVIKQAEEELPPNLERVLIKLGNDIETIGIMGCNKSWSVFWANGISGEDYNRPITYWRKINID